MIEIALSSLNPAELFWLTKTLIESVNVPLPTPPTLTERVNEAVTGITILPVGRVVMFVVSPVPVIVNSWLVKLTPFNEPLTVADSVYVTGLALAFATHSTEIIAAKTQGVNLT